MRIAVICATMGRRAEATDLARDMAAQTRPPDRLIFAVTGIEHAPPPEAGGETLICPRQGSCAQRNAALDAVDACDIAVFFDDDFIPHPTWLARLEALFAARPDLVGLTGKVVADGIKGPGLTRSAALEAIAAEAARYPDGDPEEQPRRSLYGCNMAVRTDALDGRRFDEALPLYGWLEDMDFTAPLSAKGHMVRAGALVGVHLGVKRGRTSGVRLGYSQIANPWYLARKGTMPRRDMVDNMVSNFAANLVKSLRPEPFIDRRGRVRGNLRAFRDVALGRSRPDRILDF